MPPVATNLIPGFTRSPTSLGSLQRLKNARDCAEKAMKVNKNANFRYYFISLFS